MVTLNIDLSTLPPDPVQQLASRLGNPTVTADELAAVLRVPLARVGELTRAGWLVPVADGATVEAGRRFSLIQSTAAYLDSLSR